MSYHDYSYSYDSEPRRARNRERKRQRQIEKEIEERTMGKIFIANAINTFRNNIDTIKDAYRANKESVEIIFSDNSNDPRVFFSSAGVKTDETVYPQFYHDMTIGNSIAFRNHFANFNDTRQNFWAPFIEEFRHVFRKYLPSIGVDKVVFYHCAIKEKVTAKIVIFFEDDVNYKNSFVESTKRLGTTQQYF